MALWPSPAQDSGSMASVERPPEGAVWSLGGPALRPAGRLRRCPERPAGGLVVGGKRLSPMGRVHVRRVPCEMAQEAR